MTNQYSIWIVTPPGYNHSRCFEEIALSLNDAFAELGHFAPVVTSEAEIKGTAITLGGHLLQDIPQKPELIIYNLEQIYQNPRSLTPPYVALLRHYPVWDYSNQNIFALNAIGVQATLCRVGYAAPLTCITPAPAQDIDVLFIGSINARRAKVLDALAAQDLRVAVISDGYGRRRDAVIARAKIVLNVHFYEAKLFEIVRVSYLLANRVCVVSETGLDPELETPLIGGVAFAPYDQLVHTCVELLSSAGMRDAIAEMGFEQMRSLSQVKMLDKALSNFRR